MNRINYLDFCKALDILEGEVAGGRILVEWWRESVLPWWALLEDNPRYQELVIRIDGLLEQRRALLQ